METKMRHVIPGVFAAIALTASAAPALAFDPLRPGVAFADYSHDPATPSPPRRYLTTYMAKYPFGVLREYYTPLGAPGVSKTAYFGVPRLYATLHSSPRRHYHRVASRTVLRTRY